MAEKLKVSGASLACSHWQSISWSQAEEQVGRLQMRIAKATREGKHGRASALQWILTHSFYAKVLAVKRVSQNKGSKTPGVDGVIWNSDAKKIAAVNQLKRRGYQPQPLRRVYIPKKNGKQRPLGIPCMIDKGQQALHLLGLEPISETTSDKNAYGFRPKRSAADAIEQCFKTLCRKQSAQWILEGDIKSCFDKIGKTWLLDHTPMDKQVLAKWLNAGYIDKGIFYPTEEGVPQGGICSPTITLLALSGLERAAKAAAPRESEKVNVIIYADDFIITGASQEILENKIKPAIEAFLKERGLELSQEKTKITHIQKGFNFLGFNIRKYNGKLLIKPAKSNVLGFMKNIREIIKKNKATAAGTLINILNPKLRGWGNYYRHVVSKQTFSYIHHKVVMALYQWAIRRHPNKSRHWIVRKYFYMKDASAWVFTGKEQSNDKTIQSVYLTSIAEIPIRRHRKIIADATPYDPAYADYFAQRNKKESRNTWYVLPQTAM